MKFAVAIALLGYTKALENEEGDGKTEVAQWKDTQIRYKSVNEKQCKDDYSCPGTNEVCARHMWEYNSQQESGQGCWDNSVCDKQSFYMFDGRKIQFWCDTKSNKFNGKYSSSLAYPIWAAGENHWLDWEPTCQSHQECRDKNGRSDQHCTDFIWNATEGGEAWSQGTSCYTWDRNMCATMALRNESFAIINDNYQRTKFSHYTQMWCKGYDKYFQQGAATAATSNAPSCTDAAECAMQAKMQADAEAAKWQHDNNGTGATATASDWDNKKGGDRKRDGVDMTMGKNNLRMNDKDGVEFNGEGFSMRMNEKDGQTRLEIVMGATKIAATAATAIVASTLY